MTEDKTIRIDPIIQCNLNMATKSVITIDGIEILIIIDIFNEKFILIATTPAANSPIKVPRRNAYEAPILK